MVLNTLTQMSLRLDIECVNEFELKLILKLIRYYEGNILSQSHVASSHLHFARIASITQIK